jgi:hypothetical protein
MLKLVVVAFGAELFFLQVGLGLWVAAPRA